MNLSPIEPTTENLTRELASTPGLDAVREACAEIPAFLVGGAVRDLLTGRPRGELDIAIEGPVGPVAERLGGDAVEHEAFETASLTAGGIRVDLARCRSETYPRPGALPEIASASLEDDLGRRDFTVNAMAIPLAGEPELIDPHDGLADLRAGLLRVLHEGSFADDPTRVLRGARYIARLGLRFEPQTLELARGADLESVSADRVRAELGKLAVEPEPERGLAVLADLGLVRVAADGLESVKAVRGVLSDPAWASVADLGRSVLRAAGGEGADAARELAALEFERPSQAVAALEGMAPEDLALARGEGADWLDRWLSEWRAARLEISGDDLVAAGVAEGPAIGRGLAAAQRALLDGEAGDREAQLAVALEAAGRA